MKLLKKGLVAALGGLVLMALLVGVQSIQPAKASATTLYNFGQGDLWQLLKYVFDTVNGHNHDGTNSKEITHLGTVTDAVTISNTVQGTILYSTYYARLPYYSKLTMIGSGAPAGALIARGGPANKNCGIGGDGTSIYVCASDGTNWRAVE